LLVYAVVLAFDPAPPVLLAVPALAWTGSIVCWLPVRYDRWWRFGVLPLLAVAYFFPFVVLVPLAVVFGLFLRHRPARVGAVMAAATLKPR
jgi:hypothetical protein